MRALYLRMPAVATLVLAVGAGYLIGGIRSALVVAALTLFIALSPWWDRALVTLYMATFGVVVSCLIGFTVGTLCFQNKKSAAFMLGVCDIFQTFPSFVYLIPVMMLFGITDTSVLIAVIVYSTIPAPFLSDNAFKMYWPRSSVPIKAPIMTINKANTIV